jgi:hypothetical protein
MLLVIKVLAALAIVLVNLWSLAAVRAARLDAATARASEKDHHLHNARVNYDKGIADSFACLSRYPAQLRARGRRVAALELAFALDYMRETMKRERDARFGDESRPSATA